MNPLNAPLEWTSIGEAVAGHLWHSTAFIGVCWLATLLLKKNNASIRHGIWLAASLKFLIPFFLLVGAGRYVGETAGIHIAQPEWPALPSISRPLEGLGLTARESPAPIAIQTKGSSLTPWLVFAGWFAGFAAAVLWRISRWRRLNALIGKAKPLREGREVDSLRRVRSRLGGSLRVELASSLSAIEPGVRGIVHAVLLLPSGISDRLDDDQLDSIIAHEVCHIRRRDNLAAAAHGIVETIFWFHPLVWWIGSRLLDERERACDESVVKLGNDPQVYAGAILHVCEFYMAAPQTTVSRATGSNLKTRIEDIMTQRIVQRMGSGKTLLLSGAAFALVTAPVAFGIATASQRPAEPRPVVVQPTAPALLVSRQTATPARPVTRVPSQAPRLQTQNPGLPQTSPSLAPVPASQGDYTFGPEDELEIHVWREPELTRRAVVRPDGKIGMPLLGDVPAAGQTPMQLKQYIQGELRRWMDQPDVSIIVLAVRSQATIQGAVVRPGSYSLSRPLTLMEMIALAGGLTEFARRDEIAVIRQEGRGATRHLFNYAAFQKGVNLEQNLLLKAGDIIVVP